MAGQPSCVLAGIATGACGPDWARRLLHLALLLALPPLFALVLLFLSLALPALLPLLLLLLPLLPTRGRGRISIAVDRSPLPRCVSRAARALRVGTRWPGCLRRRRRLFAAASRLHVSGKGNRRLHGRVKQPDSHLFGGRPELRLEPASTWIDAQIPCGSPPAGEVQLEATRLGRDPLLLVVVLGAHLLLECPTAHAACPTAHGACPTAHGACLAAQAAHTACLAADLLGEERSAHAIVEKSAMRRDRRAACRALLPVVHRISNACAAEDVPARRRRGLPDRVPANPAAQSHLVLRTGRS